MCLIEFLASRRVLLRRYLHAHPALFNIYRRATCQLSVNAKSIRWEAEARSPRRRLRHVELASIKHKAHVKFCSPLRSPETYPLISLEKIRLHRHLLRLCLLRISCSSSAIFIEDDARATTSSITFRSSKITRCFRFFPYQLKFLSKESLFHSDVTFVVRFCNMIQ